MNHFDGTIKPIDGVLKSVAINLLAVPLKGFLLLNILLIYMLMFRICHCALDRVHYMSKVFRFLYLRALFQLYIFAEEAGFALE